MQLTAKGVCFVSVITYVLFYGDTMAIDQRLKVCPICNGFGTTPDPNYDYKGINCEPPERVKCDNCNGTGKVTEKS